jgi:hypothetical protein
MATLVRVFTYRSLSIYGLTFLPICGQSLHRIKNGAANRRDEMNRWTITKSESGKWIVEDTRSPRAEDPVLYRFSSQRKAREFVAMLVAEAK